MAFTTTATISDRLAGLLKIDEADLAAYWTDIISDSRTRAYNEIVSRLVSRGFTLADILTWDRGAEFELDIALFWCLVSGAGLASYDDKFLKIFDRRAELDTVWVTTSGDSTEPVTGNIGSGAMDVDRVTFFRGVDADGNLSEVRW